MLTTCNCRPKQAAAELDKSPVRASAISVAKSATLVRGVTFRAPVDAVHDLATLALPERAYAIVAALPASQLADAPDPPTSSPDSPPWLPLPPGGTPRSAHTASSTRRCRSRWP